MHHRSEADRAIRSPPPLNGIFGCADGEEVNALMAIWGSAILTPSWDGAKIIADGME